MTLCEGEKNHSYLVKHMELPQASRIRLEALGLTDGTKIELLNRKRSGSVMIHVRGTRLAFGKQIAEAILIEETPAKETIEGSGRFCREV